MPDARCRRMFALLSAYLDAELPAKNCRELERHLQGCEPCIAYLESLKKTVEACRHYRVRRTSRPTGTVRKAFLEALQMNVDDQR